MEVKVKKLWLGHASVRDYVVDKCIKDKEDLTINLNGKRVTFPYRTLKTHLLNCNKNTFTSKFNGREYTLIDFPWTTI